MLRKSTGLRPQPPRKGSQGSGQEAANRPSCKMLLKDQSSCRKGNSCAFDTTATPAHLAAESTRNLCRSGGLSLAELLRVGRAEALLSCSHAPVSSSSQAFQKASEDDPLCRADPPSWSSSMARRFPHGSGLPSLLGH